MRWRSGPPRWRPPPTWHRCAGVWWGWGVVCVCGVGSSCSVPQAHPEMPACCLRIVGGALCSPFTTPSVLRHCAHAHALRRSLRRRPRWRRCGGRCGRSAPPPPARGCACTWARWCRWVGAWVGGSAHSLTLEVHMFDMTAMGSMNVVSQPEIACRSHTNTPLPLSLPLAAGVCGAGGRAVGRQARRRRRPLPDVPVVSGCAGAQRPRPVGRPAQGTMDALPDGLPVFLVA